MDKVELISLLAAFALGYWLVSMLLRLFSRSDAEADTAITPPALPVPDERDKSEL